jgi:hypothetical protein
MNQNIGELSFLVKKNFEVILLFLTGFTIRVYLWQKNVPAFFIHPG